MPDVLLAALHAVTTYAFILHLLIGVFLGLVVAILPGFGGTVGLALTLPFIYGMDPSSGVAVLVGLMSVVATADTFPAVLLGIPGSVSGQATVVDGYPLAKSGQAARALGAAFAASLMGGLFGALVLTMALQVAEPMILAFGAGELLLLGILGVTMVGVLSGKNIFRALMAAALGMLIGSIGIAPATGAYRFDFGSIYLGSGIPLTIVVLALFAVPELIELIQRKGAIAEKRTLSGGIVTGIKDALRHKWLVVRTATLGTTVGMLPGIGGSVIDWLAYGHAMQSAKDKSQFGKGDIRGVIGPEAANNAKEGGALIPTMIFGIPGSASTAVFMGGLVLLGLEPGLTMVMQSSDVIYQVIWGLALANIAGAGLCIVLANPIAALTRVPFNYIAPILLALLVLAGFQTTRTWNDLIALLAFGVLGWALLRYGFSRPAFVIGFVLSGGIESNLYATLDFYGWEVFQRPVFLVLLVACFASAFFGFRQSWNVQDKQAPRPAIDAVAFTVGCAVIGLLAIIMMLDERVLTRLFPIVAGSALILSAVGVLVRNWLADERSEVEAYGPAFKAMGIVFAMVGTVWLFGYVFGSLLFAAIFYLSRGVENRLVAAGLSIAIAVIAVILQSQLNIQLPDGLINIPDSF